MLTDVEVVYSWKNKITIKVKLFVNKKSILVLMGGIQMLSNLMAGTGMWRGAHRMNHWQCLARQY